MKKLLLAGLLCLFAMTVSLAEEFNYGTPLGADGRTICAVGSTTALQNVQLFCIDDEKAEAAISYDGSGSFTVPEQLDIVWTTHPENGEPQTLRATWNIVQINKITGVESLVIPESVKTVAPGAFVLTNIDDKTVSAITFAEGKTPIEVYPFSDYSQAYEIVEINRSIKALPYKNEWDAPIGLFFGNIGTLKIGANVGSLEGKLFEDMMGFNCKKVEFANWGNWYTKTKIDCPEGNPYRYGASISAGGFNITTVEIPEDATEIPAYKNMGLTFEGELELPETVKVIGDYAFADQKNLWSVYFPDGLETIGTHAFDGCETLTFEALPESLKSIGDYAFKGCQMQTQIVLPEGLEELGKGAFREMTALTSATMISNLTEVPDEAFAGCSALEKVYMPVDATRIGDFAFLNCFKYDEVLLPKTLEEIGMGAFMYCTSSYWTYGDDGLLGNIIRGVTEDYPDLYKEGLLYNESNKCKESVTRLVFPSSLKTIGRFAFSGQNFVSLALNDGLETIGNYAFYDNRNLISLSLPSTVQSIGEGAFALNAVTLRWGEVNSMINQVIIPDATTELGSHAFYRMIGEIVVGKGITALDNLSTGYPLVMTVGPNVTSISNNGLGFILDLTYGGEASRMKILHMEGTKSPTVTANFDLTALDYDYINVYVPDGSKSRYTANPRWKSFNIIEESEASIRVHVSQAPLSEELRLQSGIMPSRVTKMKVTGTLADTDWRILRENMISLSELDISDITNTVLPEDAMKNMMYLTKVILPKKLTSIGDNAFAGNSLMGLEEIPGTVTKIGNKAFYGCKMITISELPAELETVGPMAFYGCTSLKSITAGEHLVSIGENLSLYGEGTFFNCPALEFVDFSATKLTTIPYSCFGDNNSLTTVLLPEGLTTIEGAAFMNTSLESISIPSTVTSIGAGAFGSTLLRGAYIPEGVKSVESDTFSGCPRLVSVSFPASMESIGARVFENSKKVTGLSCPRIEAPAAETDAFTGMRALKVALTVPQQSYRNYLNAPQWGIFQNLINQLVVEIPENIEASIVDEEEYQAIVEEEDMNELYQVGDAEVELPDDFRSRARKASNESIVKGIFFSRLFHGATVATAPNTDAPGQRVFINGKVSKIELDGQDITSRFDGISILLPGNNKGTLKISATSGLEAIDADSSYITGDAQCTAFDTTGRAVYNGRRAYLEDSVVPGLYIVKSGDKTEKVLVK